jgi:hypothetical protein
VEVIARADPAISLISRNILLNFSRRPGAVQAGGDFKRRQGLNLYNMSSPDIYLRSHVRQEKQPAEDDPCLGIN